MPTTKPKNAGLIGKCVQVLRALTTRQIDFTYENMPVSIKKASYRRILNWVAVETSIALKRTQPWGLPTFLQIEPSTRCNLRCSYCPVSEGHDQPTGHFEPEIAEKLIDEVGGHALILVLWGWGEPFLTPNSYRVIRYARERGLHVISSTNGHLFTDEKKARALVESGIDSLIVSTSGMSNSSYEESRRGEFDLPLEGVQNIIKWKRNLGTKKPFISLTLIITRHNEHERDKAAQKAAALGVDLLSFKRINPTTNSTQGALPSDDYFKRFNYEDGQARAVKVNPCKAMFHKTTLRWDGKINSCTYDFFGASNLGDLNQSSFRDIWRGPVYRRARQKFRRNYRDIEICTQCTYAFEGGDYVDSVADSYTVSPDGSLDQVAGVARPEFPPFVEKDAGHQ